MTTLPRTLTTLATALLLSTGMPVFAADDASTPAVRSVIQQYENALNKGDAAAIAQLYAVDGVQMAPDAPAAVGRDAVRGAYEMTFKAIALNLKFTIDEVKTLGQDAILLRSHSAGTLKVVGKTEPAGPASFKELFVLRKQADGGWKFSHYSFSGAPAVR